MPTLLNISKASSIWRQPSFKVFSILNTPAFICIFFCMVFRIVAVAKFPSEYLNLSIFWIAFSPKLAEYLGCGELGFTSSKAVWAACLPKITMSNREFAPSLFAPFINVNGYY